MHFFRLEQGSGYPLEPAHGTQADVQIQFLTQCYIQRAYAFTYGRSEWSFYSHPIMTESLHGFSRKPGSGFIKCFLTGKYFQPVNFSLSVIRFFNRFICDFFYRSPYFLSDTITFDKWNDRIIRNNQFVVFLIDNAP